MPVIKKGNTRYLRYRYEFPSPYRNVVFDGEDFYILPEQVGKKFFGLRELPIKKHLGYDVVLYHGVRLRVQKLKQMIIDLGQNIDVEV